MITGASNEPNTTPGLANIDDAGRLVSGMAQEGLKMVDDFANYLSQPYAINKTIISAGPAIDTSVNYYASNDAKTVTQDASVFSAAGLAQVDKTVEKYSYPMNQEQVGQHSVELMPWFVAGVPKPLTTVEKHSLCELYGKKTMSELPKQKEHP
ncbi:hypothetical protein BH10CYA1_BH10CYA1_08850 [soil metagenome]